LKKYLYPSTLALAVISLTIFIACNKASNSDYGSGTNSNNIPAEKTVTASVQGRVVDDKGVPVQGAVVSSGSATTTTDVNGVFSFSKISMSSRFGYVKVNKAGFFTGSRSIITNGGASNYVSIQLMPRVSKGSVPASTGGKIVVSSGDTVILPAAGIVNAATGAAYTGNVNVYAQYLDPTDVNLPKYMPGDLRGIGSDGNETALQSYGMVGVELQGDAGEKLQVAAGKMATLSCAIPASMQATAPATIPLWYFNDSSGRWIQEGSGVRIGNSYVGQVAHFTYWNYDMPMATVNFQVRLKDENGNPLAYTTIRFTSKTVGTRIGYTDASGFSQGMIPKGEGLVMQVVTECDNTLAGMNVGPALADQDMGTITVTIGHADVVVKGTVVDCSQNPIDSGVVAVKIDGLSYNAAVVKGAFLLPVTRCYSASTTALLIATDLKASITGSVVSVSVSGLDTVDAGQLRVCGSTSSTSDQFIQFSVSGTTFNLTEPTSKIVEYTNGGTYIMGNYLTSDPNIGEIRMEFKNINGTTGTLEDTIRVIVPSGRYIWSPIQCTLSTYDSVGGYIAGSFTTIWTTSGVISGSFKVKRTNLGPIGVGGRPFWIDQNF